MANGRKARFSEADICRVLRAIKKSNVAMEIRIETDGTIRIVPLAEGTLQSRSPRAKRPPLSF